MAKYIIAFEMQHPDRFEGIFGTHLASLAREDILGDFRQIVHQLLARHQLDYDVKTPYFGLWYAVFTFSAGDFPVDLYEQVESLTRAGRDMIRKMLQNNFGLATGTRIDYKLAVFHLPSDRLDEAEADSFIRKSLAAHETAGTPYAVLSRDEVREVVSKNNILTYMQPILTLPQKNIVGFEALSRGPLDSFLHPADKLFGSASNYGFKEDLEIVCVANALNWALKLPSPYCIFINISPELISWPAFFDLINRETYRHLLPRLILELTEHLPIPSIHKLKRRLYDLEQLGIRIAMDDTGCGFLDMEMVEILRPDIVKLCITVVNQLGRSPVIEQEIRKMADSVRAIGGTLLGEGVERKEQVELLQANCVSLFQGFYHARPRPAGEMIARVS